LQAASADAFSKGTSLSDEAAKEAETTAARLNKLKNTTKDLAITAGETLLPVIAKIIDKVLPMVSSIADWASKNESLLAVIMKFAAGLGGFLLLLSGAATVIGVVTKAIAAWEVVQKVLNGTMKANPLGI